MDDSVLDEAAEDVLMLQAHMGHYDVLIHQSTTSSNGFSTIEVESSPPSVNAPLTNGGEANNPSLDSVLDSRSEVESPYLAPSSKKRQATADLDNVTELVSRESIESESTFSSLIFPPKKKKMTSEIFSPNSPIIGSPDPKSKLSDSTLESLMDFSVPLSLMEQAAGRYWGFDSTSNSPLKCYDCHEFHQSYKCPVRDNARKCWICGEMHAGMKSKCPQMLCYRCWSVGHAAADCTSNFVRYPSCFKCQRYHDIANPCPSATTSEIDYTLIFCANCGMQGHVTQSCSLTSFDETFKIISRYGVEEWALSAKRIMAKHSTRPTLISSTPSSKTHKSKSSKHDHESKKTSKHESESKKKHKKHHKSDHTHKETSKDSHSSKHTSKKHNSSSSSNLDASSFIRIKKKEEKKKRKEDSETKHKKKSRYDSSSKRESSKSKSSDTFWPVSVEKKGKKKKIKFSYAPNPPP